MRSAIRLRAGKIALSIILIACAFLIHFWKFNVPFTELPWRTRAFFSMILTFILGLYALWLVFADWSKDMEKDKHQNRIRIAGEFLVSVLFTAGFFLFWRTDLAVDDVGMALKYMDNFAEGYFYSYNPTDGPVWGVSGFIHGIVAGFFAWTHLYSPIGSLHASNFIGIVLIGVAVFRILRFYGLHPYLIFPAWATTMLASEQFLVFAKQGFETPIHLGIILFALYFFLIRKAKWMWLFFVLAVISKLDAVSIVGLLSLLYVWYERKSLLPITLKSPFWSRLFWFAIVPGVAWLVISFLMFGSPIPQTALAKSYAGHKDQSGVFFSFLWPFLANREILIAVIFCICGATVFHALLRSPLANTLKVAGINIIFVLIPFLSVIFYLIPYYFYNPLEKMGWYYVVPDFLLKFQAVLLIYLSLQALLNKKEVGQFTRIVVSSFLLVVILYFQSKQILFNVKEYVKGYSIFENERIAIGKWLKANSKPSDTLFAAHGYVARYSELYTVDLAGLNSKVTTDYNFNYLKLTEEMKPRWIVLPGFVFYRNMSSILKDYTLRKTFYNLRTFRVYERINKSKKTSDLPLSNDMIALNNTKVETGGFTLTMPTGEYIDFNRIPQGVRAEKLIFGIYRKSQRVKLEVSVYQSDSTVRDTAIIVQKENSKDFLNGYISEASVQLNPNLSTSRIIIKAMGLNSNIPEEVQLVEPIFYECRQLSTKESKIMISDKNN